MKITVNGNTFEVPDGSSVSVSNGTIVVNGNELGKTDSNKIIVEGNAGPISTVRASVEVRGSVIGNIETGGSVSCGDVEGNINARGSVSCGDVQGKVHAGGSISCGDITYGR